MVALNCKSVFKVGLLAMAQVILFRPADYYAYNIGPIRPPLGLIYLGTALRKQGITVSLIDAAQSGDWKADLRSCLGKDTIMAGVTCMTGQQIQGALDFCKTLRRMSTVPLVWGGLHPSLLPKQTAQHELVDAVVRGEGEITGVNLAKAISNGEPWETVPDVFFRRGTEVICSPPSEGFLDMDTLETPDYSLVDAEHYARHTLLGNRGLDLNTDRGCPHRCGFCYNLEFNRRQWRGASAEKVLDDVSFLVKRYDLDSVNFVSDNFFVKKSRVYDICNGLLQRNLKIKWHGDIRIDTFLRFEDDFLDCLKRSGCHWLTFGVESGSERVLGQIDKDIGVQDVLKAHERAHKLGFITHYHFMIGFPDETKEDIGGTLELIEKLTQNQSSAVYGPSVFCPYPGTTLYRRLLELGFQPPESLEGWSDYDFEGESQLHGFDSAYRGYLREVTGVSKFATVLSHGLNPILSIGRSYFRLRLKGLIHGIRLGRWDAALATKILRLMPSIRNPKALAE
jgi:radical SAM superfamily enzyme YgiQ (UPF0313 family)